MPVQFRNFACDYGSPLIKDLGITPSSSAQHFITCEEEVVDAPSLTGGELKAIYLLTFHSNAYQTLESIEAILNLAFDSFVSHFIQSEGSFTLHSNYVCLTHKSASYCCPTRKFTLDFLRRIYKTEVGKERTNELPNYVEGSFLHIDVRIIFNKLEVAD